VKNELAVRNTVRELVAIFQAAERDVRAGFDLLSSAEQRLNEAFVLNGSNQIRLQSRFGTGIPLDADAVVEKLSRQVWWHIVERLELRRMLSVERWSELQRKLWNEQTYELPPITEEAVFSFAKQYMDALPEMVTEAIVEVFEWLRPRPHTKVGKLKTNTELEVGPKVILGHICERNFPSYRDTGFHVRYGYAGICDAAQQLIALENVFYSLDGRGQIADSHKSELQQQIDAADRPSHGETDLFRWRSCENGNLHLEFKRLDLLARFNRIAGGARLRPAPQKASGM
jgi:hypothetical protein